LPVASQDIAAPNLPVTHNIRGGNEKILLVEDEKAVRDVVLQTLENHGYVVVEADSGFSARQAWTRHGGSFDLLMTDLVLPGGVTGLELCDLLRAHKPGLKVLLASGYSAELTTLGLASAKGITILRKPFSTLVLAETVRKCLDSA
jgi:CheY-like chemotaxis protein